MQRYHVQMIITRTQRNGQTGRTPDSIAKKTQSKRHALHSIRERENKSRSQDVHEEEVVYMNQHYSYKNDVPRVSLSAGLVASTGSAAVPRASPESLELCGSDSASCSAPSSKTASV